ncbi:neuropeptide W [Vulpes lagopus]|uniref:neuropeptide W n=1 Tax=Vulpes lagopus TaxID=494514 RepID=UPI001BC9ED8C|nr:neuropeptide W [Vulpes lagopus]
MKGEWLSGGPTPQFRSAPGDLDPACPAGGRQPSTLAWGTGPRGPAGRRALAPGLLLLLLALPAGAWYKHVASPRYPTVGRAAGLLVGLRRSPYLWRRTLRPAASPGAFRGPYTLGLGASLGGPSAGDAGSAAPGPRGALLLPSGLPELLETGRRLSRAALPARAPRSPRAAEPAPGLEPLRGAGRRSPEKQARAFRVPPAQPWSAEPTAFAGPRRSPEPS